LDGDALSKKFNDYLSDWIEKNIDRNKCKIIMLENPPFAEPQGNASKGQETFTVKDIYIKRWVNINLAKKMQTEIWQIYLYGKHLIL